MTTSCKRLPKASKPPYTRTPHELRKLCKYGDTLNLLTPERIGISHPMYRLVSDWQDKNKHPRLLFFRESGAYYMARC